MVIAYLVGEYREFIRVQRGAILKNHSPTPTRASYRWQRIDPWLWPSVMVGCLVAGLVGDTAEVRHLFWRTPTKHFSDCLSLAGVPLAIATFMAFAFPLSPTPWLRRLIHYSLGWLSMTLCFLAGYGIFRGSVLDPQLVKISLSVSVFLLSVVSSSYLLNQLLFPLRLYRGAEDEAPDHRLIDQLYSPSRFGWILGAFLLGTLWAMQQIQLLPLDGLGMFVLAGLVTSCSMLVLFIAAGLLLFRWLAALMLIVLFGGMAFLTKQSIFDSYSTLVTAKPWNPIDTTRFAAYTITAMVVMLIVTQRMPRILKRPTTQEKPRLFPIPLTRFWFSTCLTGALILVTLVMCHQLPYYYDVPFATSDYTQAHQRALLIGDIRRTVGGLVRRKGTENIEPVAGIYGPGDIHRLRLVNSKQLELLNRNIPPSRVGLRPVLLSCVIRNPQDVIRVATWPDQFDDLLIQGVEMPQERLSQIPKVSGLTSMEFRDMVVTDSWLTKFPASSNVFLNCQFQLTKQLVFTPWVELNNCQLNDSVYTAFANSSSELSIIIPNFENLKLSEAKFREMLSRHKVQIVPKGEKGDAAAAFRRDWFRQWPKWAQDAGYSEEVIRSVSKLEASSQGYGYIGPAVVLTSLKTKRSEPTDSSQNATGKSEGDAPSKSLMSLRVPFHTMMRPEVDLEELFKQRHQLVNLTGDWKLIDAIENQVDRQELEDEPFPRLRMLQIVNQLTGNIDHGKPAIDPNVFPLEELDTLVAPTNLAHLKSTLEKMPKLKRLGFAASGFRRFDDVEILAKLPQLSEIRVHLSSNGALSMPLGKTLTESWVEELERCGIQAKTFLVFNLQQLDFEVPLDESTLGVIVIGAEDLAPIEE